MMMMIPLALHLLLVVVVLDEIIVHCFYLFNAFDSSRTAGMFFFNNGVYLLLGFLLFMSFMKLYS
jgi:hypothetical protein